MIERVDLPHVRPIARIVAAHPRGHAVLYPSERDTIYQRVVKDGDFYEHAALDLIRSLDIRGTYIDVGAHCGNHTVYFLRECKPSSVVAIEPAPDLYPLLRDNASHHSRAVGVPCYVVNAAVGMLGAPPKTLVGGDDSNAGGRYTVDANSDSPWAALSVTLDDIAGTVAPGPVGYIKLDVEGSEAAVIGSAPDVIESDHPVITAECAWRKDGGNLVRAKDRAVRDEITTLLASIAPNAYAAPVPFPAHTESWLWRPK
jgi:FkbM family methyltransferase